MEYKKVVVAGGGILGSQIAFQSAYCGYDITILVKDVESISGVKDKLNTLYNTYIETINSMNTSRDNWAIFSLPSVLISDFAYRFPLKEYCSKSQ